MENIDIKDKESFSDNDEKSSKHYKLDGNDILAFLDEGMMLYIGFLAGKQASSFVIGIAFFILMMMKKTFIAAMLGNGNGRVKVESLVDKELATSCIKHSAWLDALINLGFIVALKYQWIMLG